MRDGQCMIIFKFIQCNIFNKFLSNILFLIYLFLNIKITVLYKTCWNDKYEILEAFYLLFEVIKNVYFHYNYDNFSISKIQHTKCSFYL